jgi:hypothetical protein
MRTLAAAALLALAWPAAAHAAAAGGGTAPDSVRGYRDQLTIVTVRPKSDGTAIVRALVQARCGAGEIKRTVTLAPDGSFAITTTQHDRAPQDRRVRRIAAVNISGRMVGPVASGTVSARVRFVLDGDTVERCRSGTRAWQARIAAAEPAAGAPVANRGYFGLTSEPSRPHAFLLRVGAGAARVQTTVFEYRLSCGSRSVETTNVAPGGRIAPDGTFSLRERFALHYSDGIERFRVKVDGQFTAAGVNGTLSVSSRFGSERCATGPLTFAGAL